MIGNEYVDQAQLKKCVGFTVILLTIAMHKLKMGGKIKGIFWQH